ncbi:unnamed protein product [Spirodela intermedia]|uniref:SAND domain-containing protein n=1 Tax=Spirodela intermedia TaxID=51605 RepID=A0A7I8IN83_SPIIN|nr:unnamed protein product [Spirodela intermedia]CAA6658425.1 unnamed protein product [Spirodela intermedia]
MAAAKGAADRDSGAAMFSEEELSEISGLKQCRDYIEVTCGCTSRRYGDAVGRLKVFPSGELEITCECTPGCDEDKMSPAAFEKHSGRETARKWKSNVWVIVKGEKISLSKTALLKYHDQLLKPANGSHKGHGGRAAHRDEFIRCARCSKERRFRLRTREELTCEEDEERASRKNYRGCARSPRCKGCTACVCFGCDLCRFPDCACQTCVDFMSNA